jgi:hypothetical protein
MVESEFEKPGESVARIKLEPSLVVTRGEGRVVVERAAWVAAIVIVIGVGLVVTVLKLVREADVNTVASLGGAQGIGWLGWVVIAFGVCVGLVGLWMLPERKWVQVSDERLSIWRARWLGARELEGMPAGDVERALVYRKWFTNLMGARCGAGELVVLKLGSVPGRHVLLQKVEFGAGAGEARVREINAMLGLAGEGPVEAEGLLVNGVLFKGAGDEEVFLREPLPEGWLAVEGEKVVRNLKVERGVEGLVVVRGVKEPGLVLTTLWSAGLGLPLATVVVVLGLGDYTVAIGMACPIVTVLLAGAAFTLAWLMDQERLCVRDGEVELRKRGIIGVQKRRVKAQEIKEVTVSCVGRALSETPEFMVGVRLKRGGYVKLVTGIVSAEEAMEIRDGIREKLGGSEAGD